MIGCSLKNDRMISVHFQGKPFNVMVIRVYALTSNDFIFLGSRITADAGCSHEIKRQLLLGRKVMTNLDSILKSRDITLPTKVHLVKAMDFQQSCLDVRVGLQRKLSTEELMLLNCGVGEDSWESFGLRGDPTSPSYRRSVLNVHWKEYFGHLM